MKTWKYFAVYIKLGDKCEQYLPRLFHCFLVTKSNSESNMEIKQRENGKKSLLIPKNIQTICLYAGTTLCQWALCQNSGTWWTTCDLVLLILALYCKQRYLVCTNTFIDFTYQDPCTEEKPIYKDNSGGYFSTSTPSKLRNKGSR